MHENLEKEVRSYFDNDLEAELACKAFLPFWKGCTCMTIQEAIEIFAPAIREYKIQYNKRKFKIKPVLDKKGKEIYLVSVTDLDTGEWNYVNYPFKSISKARKAISHLASEAYIGENNDN